MDKRYLLTGSIFCAIAVMMGAFGAHALKSILTAESLQSFQTAVQYQFFHGMALLVVGMLSRNTHNGMLLNSGRFFTMGIICFSGSIYLLIFMKQQQILFPQAFALITPLGGVLLILGWLGLAGSFLKK